MKPGGTNIRTGPCADAKSVPSNRRLFILRLISATALGLTLPIDRASTNASASTCPLVPRIVARPQSDTYGRRLKRNSAAGCKSELFMVVAGIGRNHNAEYLNKLVTSGS